MNRTLIILFVLMALSLGCSRAFSPELETDAQLIAFFERHRDGCERIRTAYQAKNSRGIIEELKGLGREGSRLDTIPGSHLFLIHLSPEHELPGGGYIHLKALAWCEAVPPKELTLANLDRAPKGWGRYYRHIEGHWYLFIQTSKLTKE